MISKITYFTITVILTTTFAFSQDTKADKATSDFENYAFAKAISSYEKLISKGYTSEEIFKNLGNANYQNAQYKSASEWYGKLFELVDGNIENEYIYKYAQTLKSLGLYSESDQWMQKFQVAEAVDNRALKFSSNKEYLKKIKENSGRYNVKNISLNSKATDFAPSYYGEDIVFSSARDTGRITKNIHAWNNKNFTNLYRAESGENGTFSSVEKLSTALNKKTHESSTAFTKDGNTIYFTRNNSKNGKFNRDKKGLSRLKIYKATLSEGLWKQIKELSFNSDEYSVAHPTLSADEKKLYFASDMPGTIGQSDIFVVAINEDGSFGTPKNLGNKINTEGRETFPMVTQSDILYFASDGHPGLGGLDVFATKIDDMDNLYIVNLGEPINSKQDDFSLIINESAKNGFFASNRDGGNGSDDIYSFEVLKEIDLTCTKTISGIVKNKETNEPISQALLTLLDNENKAITTIFSKDDGTFNLEGNCKKGVYNISTSRDKYAPSSIQFMTTSTDDKNELQIMLEKEIQLALVGDDLIKFLKLSPVYFDLDKSDIRSDAKKTLAEVIAYMKSFPGLRVEVQSHTDAKASVSYNQRLSNRRAKETIAYLIAHGIDESRISGKGFGESKLVNACITRNKCEDSEHQINRRSEFIIKE